MRAALIVALLMTPLSACVTSQERAEQEAQQQAAQMEAMKAKWAHDDDAKCSSWFKKGTQAYGDCRLKIDLNRRTALASLGAATAQANAVTNAAIISRPPPPVVFQAAPVFQPLPPQPIPALTQPSSVNCTSIGSGNMVNTNCHQY
jgi:hypothetical protein